MTRVKWSKDLVISEILLRQTKGLPLNYQEVVKENEKLTGAARRYFGTWDNAMLAAGFSVESYKNPDTEKMSWDREEVLRQARVRLEKGLPMAPHDVQKSDSKLYAIGCFYLGSWKNVITALDLDYSEIKMTQEWSKEKIIKKIKSVTKRGVDLSDTTVQALAPDLYGAAMTHFKSWGGAVEAAGLDYAQVRRTREWTKESVLELASKAYDVGVSLAQLRELGILHNITVRKFFTCNDDLMSHLAAKEETCISNDLHNARKAAGITLEELGRILGRSHSWVRLVESGKVTPSLEMALKICITLKKPLDEVFWIEKEKNDNHKPSVELFNSIRNENINRMYTPIELANLLGLTRAAIYQRRKAGTIPPFDEEKKWKLETIKHLLTEENKDRIISRKKRAKKSDSISDEEVFSQLKKLELKYGSVKTRQWIDEGCIPSYNVLLKRYKSFPALCKLAGVSNDKEYRKKQRKGTNSYSDEDIINAIRTQAQLHDGSLSLVQYQQSGQYPYFITVIKRFDSFEKACDAAGVKYINNRGKKARRKIVSDEEIFEQLRQLETKHGTVNTRLWTEELCRPPYPNLRKRFGSFANVCKLAGVKYAGESGKGPKRYTDDEIINAVRAQGQKHGGSLSLTKYQKSGQKPSIHVIFTRFKSFENACQAAGINCVRENEINRKEQEE